MIKVSIILPIYNAEATLARCIKSLLCQSYTNFEIIAINDGSTDNSLNILNKLATTDNRIKIFSQKKSGVSIARNLGLRSAHGEYITFCDADDEVLSNWLLTMINNISTRDFIATGITFIKQDGSEYKRNPCLSDITDSLSSKDLIINLISNEVFGFLWCKLFRKDIIINNRILFDPNISFREDELWCVNYLSHIKSWKTIPKANYRYYLPVKGKKYFGTCTDFIDPIFRIYRTMFQSQPPAEVANAYYKTVRNQLVMDVLMGGGKLTVNTSIFKYILIGYNRHRSIIARLIDVVLVHSKNHKKFAKFILKIKHRND